MRIRGVKFNQRVHILETADFRQKLAVNRKESFSKEKVRKDNEKFTEHSRTVCGAG